jgi:hypothetical protein
MFSVANFGERYGMIVKTNQSADERQNFGSFWGAVILTAGGSSVGQSQSCYEKIKLKKVDETLKSNPSPMPSVASYIRRGVLGKLRSWNIVQSTILCSSERAL